MTATVTSQRRIAVHTYVVPVVRELPPRRPESRY
jgi:hypothetical protein